MSDLQLDSFTDLVLDALEEYSGTTTGKMLAKAYDDRDYKQCDYLLREIWKMEREEELRDASI